MNFENIQMVVVRRKNDGVKINISQVNEENRYEEYECIMCGSKVIPVAPEGKIIGGANAKVTPYFKHLNADKCGSESFVHFWVKTEYIKIGDRFKVFTDKENEFICNQIFFEKTIVVDGRKYTPDATILTSCGNTIHFEYNYSNKKNIKNYLETWNKLNQIIIEVDINSILCVFNDLIPTFKALYYEGKCFNLKDDDDFYYKNIGKYKLTQNDKNVLHSREIELEKLDYLWEEIQKIRNEDKDYNEIGNLIRAISSKESRKVAIDILSRAKCGNSILQNYITFIKSNIDKHLKLLNLKYNRYLIKYETEIPRLVYDRIFNGIVIKFYIPDDNSPEICQIYDYNFKDDILSDSLKQRIDNVVEDLSTTHELLLKVLNILQINNKILNYKLNYKENTDYINAIYFEDYRNKCFVLSRDYYNIEGFKRYNPNSFESLLDENTSFITLNYIYMYNKQSFYITETLNSYELNRISSNFIRYKFIKFIKQENINMSYFYMDKFLPRYNFVK
jgi:hypothetical protein